MSHFRSATANISVLVTAAITASCTAAPASAWSCPGVTPEQIAICEREARETPTAPSTSSGSGSGVGGITDWISDHASWIVIGLIVIAVIWAVAASSSDTAKKTVEQEATMLARGRAIAQDRHAEQIRAAHDAVAAQRPDPAVYDPDGIGLAPPPMPAPDLPAAPPQSDADLRRYAEFNAVVPWIAGSAFASVVTREGAVEPADTAWLEATRAAKLGDFDAETNTFTPAATLMRVEQLNGEDVRLIVAPRDIFVTEQQLNHVHAFLVKTAHVVSASPFTRDHATGNYATVLTNRVPAASAPVAQAAPQQQAAPAASTYNDDDDWI
jgi:hypothetical protein